MEEVAQGRVWAGKDAASRGLVNAIGGLSRVVTIAKLKANIPQDTEVGDKNLISVARHMLEVTLVELARPSPSLPKLLSGVGSTLVGVAFQVWPRNSMGGRLKKFWYGHAAYIYRSANWSRCFEGYSGDTDRRRRNINSLKASKQDILIV